MRALGFLAAVVLGPAIALNATGAGAPARVSAPSTAHGSVRSLARSRWSLLARSPLGPRFGATLAWDGRQLIDLGGTHHGTGPLPALHSAAAFNPVTRTWRRIAGVPPGVQAVNTASVWTGRRLFVFGAAAGVQSSTAGCCAAGLYDPATGRWSASARAPLDRLGSVTAVWDGRRVIVAGVRTSRAAGIEAAAFDPATGVWARLDPPSETAHPALALAIVATDRGVVLWSMWGRSRQTAPRSFTILSGVDVDRLAGNGRWTAATARWPQHDTVDQPIFTGSRVLLAPGQIWCGPCSHPAPIDSHGYSVDPATLRRSALPHGPLDDLGPQVLWTGAAELSFNAGGEITGPHVRVLPGDLAIFDPATGRWRRAGRAPRAPGDAPAVWADGRLFVLGRRGWMMAFG
jgi:hypothetical protein